MMRKRFYETSETSHHSKLKYVFLSIFPMKVPKPVWNKRVIARNL